MASSKRAQKKGRPAKGRKAPAKRKSATSRAGKNDVKSNGAWHGAQSAVRKVASLPVTTVLATAETMVRCSRPFAELPLRAAQARSPKEMLSVHARFVQDVVSESLAATKRFWTLAA
jgi:hypothetical protein